MYPLLKLKVFVDEITAFMEGRNKDLAGIAEKVLKSTKQKGRGQRVEVVDHRTRERREEQGDRFMRSCGRKLRECSTKEGVELARSVEKQGVDLRTRTKQLEAKERARRKKCDVRFFFFQQRLVFQKLNMRIGVRKLLRMGLVLARAWRGQAVGITPAERLMLWRQMAAAAGKEASVALSLFMEVYILGVEENFPPWPRFVGRKMCV